MFQILISLGAICVDIISRLNACRLFKEHIVEFPPRLDEVLVSFCRVMCRFLYLRESSVRSTDNGSQFKNWRCCRLHSRTYSNVDKARRGIVDGRDPKQRPSSGLSKRPSDFKTRTFLLWQMFEPV